MNNLKTDLKNAQKEVNKTIKSLLPAGKGIEKKLFEASLGFRSTLGHQR